MGWLPDRHGRLDCVGYRSLGVYRGLRHAYDFGNRPRGLLRTMPKLVRTDGGENLKITEEFAESLEVEEADDWKHFDILKLPAAETDEYPRFVGEVLQCPDCSETTAIRLTLLTQKEGDNGLEEVSKPIDGIILMPSSSEA